MAIREYLAALKKDKKVLEYSLFFPGQFLNYLGSPNKTARHLSQLTTWLDFPNTRAILVEGVDERLSFTTVQDLAAVVARAAEYAGEWPVVGGVNGNTLTSEQMVALGEKYPAVPKNQAELFSRKFVISALQGSLTNAWEVSDEWNQLIPGFEFTSVEKLLTEVWAGKD
ncbi:hypothetical protein B0H67DRAFT_667402, partial [Lasiosphaeris hirsuta]